MVILFVILTIIFFIAIDYSINKREVAKKQSMPLFKFASILPDGVFIQPTYTWSKLLNSGKVLVGVHPLITGLIGEPDEIQLLRQGEIIKKGDNLLKITKGDKTINISAPFDGCVISLNNDILEDANLETVSRGWLYSIEPINIADEISKWMVAEKARTWLQKRYTEIKEFFISSYELNAISADGGDLPVGILSSVNSSIWNEFGEKFIK